MTFLNRIVETGEVDPKKLLPNPKNWRKHPDNQAEAMSGILDEIGWIQPDDTTRRPDPGYTGAVVVSARTGDRVVYIPGVGVRRCPI